MKTRRAAVLAAIALIGLAVNAGAQTPSNYHAPRTAWGDPDLEGNWPSGGVSSVPLQRPQSFGTRNVLTDQEFAERESQITKQVDQDGADFDFDHPSIPFGQIGGGQSPPPHWL